MCLFFCCAKMLIMKTFDGIKFGGTFRNYQQRVLDNCKKYYSNNKIHIVAAPGSGKTILGLELIARLKNPCLILSPTNTIKYQWGERFNDFYLPKGEKTEEYVSYDLNNVKLLTSITYQALHSAIDKIATQDEDGIIDYSNLNLFKLINDYGIKTICVDEAHHLQNEWQKALEKFMAGLKKDVKVIALTATPPYDANKTEWNRYIKICGEIDEEIYVTELVKAKNLCPHQDYIYFNYPTEEETLALLNYNNSVNLMLNEFKNLPYLNEILNGIIKMVKEKHEIFPDETKKIIAVLSFLHSLGYCASNEVWEYFSRCKSLLCTNEKKAVAVQYLLDAYLITESQKQEIKTLLKKYGLLQRNKVYFELSDKLKRNLMCSLGKLNSICSITKSEYANLSGNLRELVLTDYIKKEDIKLIGTTQQFTTISIISIFENLRRQNPNLNLGVLSGEVCILPTEFENQIKETYKIKSKLVCKPLNNTNYAVYKFKLPNKEKVKIVGEIFASGKINVLVGTKSLLGEGWDSPCINSLILASFVGSFMLSNQMRGRAIRVNKHEPNKTANIWHLVTLEPTYVSNEVNYKNQTREIEKSVDYATLTRRFNCFVGPNHKTNNIESGIKRVSLLKAEYSQNDIQQINEHTLELSNNRQNLFAAWGMENVDDTSLYMSTNIPKDRCFVGLKKSALILSIISFILLMGCVGVTIYSACTLNNAISCLVFILGGMLSILCGYLTFINAKHFVNYGFIVPLVKTVSKCILLSLKQLNMVNKFANLKITKDGNNAIIILKTENIRQQTIFQNALCEFFEIIEDARYLIIKKNVFEKYNYKYVFKCPDVFANKKENVKILCDTLRKYLGNFYGIYTNNQFGEKVLFNAQKKSYINEDSKEIIKKMSL